MDATRKKAIRWSAAAGITVLAFFGIARGLDRVWGNTDISFYGQVVDDAGKPIDGATVIGHISAERRLQLPILWSSSGYYKVPFRTVSGHDGRFEITSMRGRFLVVERVMKDGFSLVDVNGESYCYDKSLRNVTLHIPDPRHPTQIRMEPKRATKYLK